jgi:hypothetical protein
MSVAKSKERLLLEARLVKCGYNPQNFINLGRNDNKEAISSDNKEVKKLENDNKKLKDKINALEADLAKRSNLYCWHCGFELRHTCPRWLWNDRYCI